MKVFRRLQLRRDRLWQALLGVVTFFALWQVLAWIINRDIMPPPADVLPVFFSDIGGSLGAHTLASAGRVLAAMLLAVLLAAPAALALGQFRAIDRIFAPLIGILYPLPKIVLLPVVYVLFGISDASKILMIALIIFFQILVVVRDQAASIRPELLVSVRSLGAGRRALFRYVYIPASLPAVLTALRVSVGIAIAVLVFVEQSLTRVGLGYYIFVETYPTLRYRQMWAGILAMSLLGLLLYFALNALERLVNPAQFIEDK